MKNFGQIKNTFNEILVDSLITKDKNKKKLFQKYVKALKENKILAKEFNVYINLQSKVGVDTFYVTENLKALENINRGDIVDANNILIALLDENKVALTTNYANKELDEEITKLIFMRRCAKKIEDRITSINNIVEYTKNNTPKEPILETSVLPISTITKMMVNKLNEKYGSISDDEKQLVKSIVESDDKNKEEIQNKIISECVSLVNSELTESDVNAKEKLLAVKERLLEMKFNKESFIEDISKLIELQKDLKG